MIDIPSQLEKVIVETAKIKGISPTEFLTKAVQAQIDEPFDYDLERMQERVKGYETPDLALANGIEAPDFDTVEEIRYWRKNVLPKIKAELYA